MKVLVIACVMLSLFCLIMALAQRAAVTEINGWVSATVAWLATFILLKEREQ